MPPRAAPLLPTLGVLRLGSNLLTSVPDRCFSACPGLIELYLNNNTIHTLGAHAFSGLRKLEVGRLATTADPWGRGSSLTPLGTFRFWSCRPTGYRCFPSSCSTHFLLSSRSSWKTTR